MNPSLVPLGPTPEAGLVEGDEDTVLVGQPVDHLLRDGLALEQLVLVVHLLFLHVRERLCSITWGAMELRPNDRSRRAEVHYGTSNTILFRFEAEKRTKIALRVLQKLYRPPEVNKSFLASVFYCHCDR